MVSPPIAAILLSLSALGEPVLLEFQSDQCGPCRMMQPIVERLQSEGRAIRAVNVERERSLAAKYGVRAVPCFVLVSQGKEVARITGATTRAELLALLAQAPAERPAPGGEPSKQYRGQSPDRAIRMVASTERDWRQGSPSSDVLAARGGAKRASGASFSAGDRPAAVATKILIEASVRLSIEDAAGISHGSGTLIDAREGEALVLTCGHIFRDSQGKGRITVDLFTPNGSRQVSARLIRYDLKRDLGLVSIPAPQGLRTIPVAGPNRRVKQGEPVISVGCDHGRPPTAKETRITGIDKFVGSPNFVAAGQPVEGRSGGGLFTRDGSLIGVCNAADPQDNEGLYSALAAIHAELDRANLSAIYRAGERALAREAKDSPRRNPIERASAPSLVAASAAAGGVENETPRRRSISDDQAFDPLAGARAAEVVCIVRPLGDSQAPSEVIVLDRASSAFLQQLAEEKRFQNTRRLTSHAAVRSLDGGGQTRSGRDR